MPDLRAYRQDDLSGLAAAWNQAFSGQPNYIGVSEADLARRVTAQPSFDAAGLLVAAPAGRILGFVHFGTRIDFREHLADRTPDATEGQVYVLVAPRSEPGLARELLAAAVERLEEAGARQVLLGPSWLHGAQFFYNGIAGAYEFPGLSAARHDLLALAADAGFEHIAEYGTPELDLSDDSELRALRGKAEGIAARARAWGLTQQTRRLAANPVFADRHCVELLIGPEFVAITAYGLWEEYAREYGRRLFGLTSIHVAPQWRGRGLGKLVVIRALEAAAGAGAEGAHLHVWRGNEVAWNLYHRALGFKPKHQWATLAKRLAS